jgi:hypothetical protein
MYSPNTTELLPDYQQLCEEHSIEILTCPTQEHDIGCKESSSQEPWFTVNELQVVLLSSIPRDSGPEFNVYKQTCSSYTRVSENAEVRA